MPGLHIEVCKDPQAVIDYCAKSETRIEGPYWFNLSETPESHPVRSDLRKLISQVKSGVSLGELAEGDHPEHVLKYHVGLEKVLISAMEYNLEPTTIIHMTPQQAKSRAEGAGVYVTSDGLFDDYESQPIVIWAYSKPPNPGLLFKLEMKGKKTLPSKGFLKRPSNIHELIIIDYPSQKDT